MPASSNRVVVLQQQGRQAGPTPPPSQVYRPAVYSDPGTAAAVFSQTPEGCILHGSRSGQAGNTVQQEFDGTRRFATVTDLGWSITAGDDAISIHMPTAMWGWNARAASRRYLAVEFAQPVERPISDAQVRAFCWWVRRHALATFPTMPLRFPTHAEVERWGQTGAHDGKSDVFSYGSPAADELRARIAARLADTSWVAG